MSVNIVNLVNSISMVKRAEPHILTHILHLNRLEQTRKTCTKDIKLSQLYQNTLTPTTFLLEPNHIPFISNMGRTQPQPLLSPYVQCRNIYTAQRPAGVSNFPNKSRIHSFSSTSLENPAYLFNQIEKIKPTLSHGWLHHPLITQLHLYFKVVHYPLYFFFSSFNESHYPVG